MNKQISYLQISCTYQLRVQTTLLHPGAIEHVKITLAGSGGTNGTYTNVAIRGDGSSGTVQ